MPAANNLHIFTVNFPLGDGEPFLYNELLTLHKKFDKIYLFPMQDHDKTSGYSLPANVEVVKFKMFQPYNRLAVLSGQPAFVFGLFFSELLTSPNRWQYLVQFKNTLNDLTHKIAMAQKLDAFLQSPDQEMTIAYTYWFNQWTFILSILHKLKPRFKLFTRIHGSDVYEEQHTERGFFFKFRKFQLKHITKVFAISANGRQHLATVNKGFDDKITVSRLGVIGHGAGPKEDKAFYRLVSCSGFQRYKRVHLIIEILKKVKEPVEWVHFGDGELQEEILKQAEQLPENTRFTWMGFKANKEIIDYYKTHGVDLFVNVSETEGIPVSVMEAISFGIPAMATNVGGVSEIVNARTGYLIPKHFNIEDAAGQISRHFNLPAEQKQKLQEGARDFWLQNYNAVVNYESLYREITHV